MKIIVIASGSSGNCCYVETENHKILIDVGISYRRIADNLLLHGHSIDSIDMLFLTHEHIDHVGGLAIFLKKSSATLYLSRGCYDAIMNGKNEPNRVALGMHEARGMVRILTRLGRSSEYEQLLFDSTSVRPIQTFHDAAEPVGFVILDNEKKFVLITDTGYIHKNNFEFIENADCYVLECNHDPEILMNSSRPYALKMRILSDHGHLSNEDALYALTMMIGDKTKAVFYAHISEECNLWEIVDLTRKRVFNDVGVSSEGIDFVFTSQTPTKEYEI